MIHRLLMALALVGTTSAAMGYATYAYFSDTATIDATAFVSGTVDLTTSDAAVFTTSLGSANFAPGDARSGSLTLTNGGSISDVVLDWSMTVTQTDALGGPTDLAQFIQVTSLSYAGDDYTSATDGGVAIADSNSNGWTDLADVTAAGPFTAKSDPGASGRPLAVAVLFRGEATNALQGDSADIGFTFLLRQPMEPALS